jgi:hypothetical protein
LVHKSGPESSFRRLPWNWHYVGHTLLRSSRCFA